MGNSIKIFFFFCCYKEAMWPQDYMDRDILRMNQTHTCAIARETCMQKPINALTSLKLTNALTSTTEGLSDAQRHKFEILSKTEFKFGSLGWKGGAQSHHNMIILCK